MDINKLPKWAQGYIKDIIRQRDVAVRELNEYVDTQTVSPIYIDEMVCTGEARGPSIKRRYIQSHGVTVFHEGVELNVLLRDKAINITWAGEEHCLEDVAFIPSSYQSARLVNKDNMR